MMVNKDYVANDADTAIVWPLNAIYFVWLIKLIDDESRTFS